jgi:chromosome partitioning protein
MARIIAFSNQKGGVGKTTSCVNVAAGLAIQGKKVLVVDADPQANTTRHLGFDPKTVENTLLELLRDQKSIDEIIIKNCFGVDLLPSRKDLSAAEFDLVIEIDRETFLKEKLGEIANGYDYVLIDTPPSLGMLAIDSLVYADEVFIPVKADYLAMEGIGQLMDVIGLIKNSSNERLKVAGIIITMFNYTNLAKGVIDEVKGAFGDIVFKTKIRQTVALAEAPGFGQPIFQYQPRSFGASDYRLLSNEILNRG